MSKRGVKSRFRVKKIGNNNRKGRHYYQEIKVDGKIVTSIKHRIDGASMKPKLA